MPQREPHHPGAIDAHLTWRSAPIAACALDDSDAINRAIEEAVATLTDQDFDARSHFIEGRFENLYLDRSRIPALAHLLDITLVCAGRFLGRPHDALRCGFWFNRMAPGQRTSRHTHEEDGELVSAVYYVTVPPDSGDLLFFDGPAIIRLRPSAGRLLLFPADLPHEVETNLSDAIRLSIGINVGPKSPDPG